MTYRFTRTCHTLLVLSVIFYARSTPAQGAPGGALVGRGIDRMPSHGEMFVSMPGAVVMRELIPIGMVGELEISRARLTNIVRGDSLVLAHISVAKTGEGFDLDPDEAMTLVQALGTLTAKVLPLTPAYNTEAISRTRNGAELRCMRNSKAGDADWTITLRVPRERDGDLVIVVPQGDVKHLTALLENAIPRTPGQPMPSPAMDR